LNAPPAPFAGIVDNWRLPEYNPCMTGPIVNAAAVLICALIGCFILKGIPVRFEELIKKVTGLFTLFLGIKGAMESKHMLLMIMCLFIGAIIGELIDIDKWMNRLGMWAERQLGKISNPKNADNAAPAGKKSFSKGFVTASILYCTGSMAIVGSLQSGLQGSHDILYAKSILDGSMSIVFGASLGIGVAFSAIPIIVYQGGIALAAMAIKDYLTPVIITEMSAVGSLLISAIGINFLVPETQGHKEIKVANLIPAIFLPWVYFAVRGLFGL
ncbi:MAG: DUF554 domain-containing protein, partial [Treponema sp.]|nr:DUF554 domain-containing protein [Treponema sp.]